MKQLLQLCMLSAILAFTGCAAFDFVNPSSVQDTLPFSDQAVMVQTDTACVRSAVTVGLTKVDPAKWDGWQGVCPGADIDEAVTRSYIDRSGAYTMRFSLRDLKATKYSLVASCITACQGLKSNDLLFVSISSHGGEAPNSTPGEAEENDQYICLADGPLLDDTVGQLIDQAKKRVPGIRLALWLDMCNSGTMSRDRKKAVRPRKPHDYAAGYAKRIRGRRDVPDGSGVLIISGCADGMSSYGDQFNGGTLTHAGFSVAGPNGLTYIGWFNAIKPKMPSYQIPQFSMFGRDFSGMEAMR